jgi:hypothetical protein
MKIKPNLILISILLTANAVAQENLELSRSLETITRQPYTKEFDNRYLFYPIGKNDNVIFLYENLEDHKVTLYALAESKSSIEKLSPNFSDYLTRDHNNHNILEDILFFTKLNFDSPDDYGYYDFYITRNGKDYFLDSIYNADKKIHSSFSSDGRYLLVNTLNTLSDYYNPEQDNQIMVYDLAEIDRGIIKKEYIPCFHCSDSYLVGDQLFFSIGRKDGYDGFSNKDIYTAPWGSLKDSVKVADNTDILAISPDGKYILGSRFWDRQKNTAVIVDVQQKKYQMLLERDYANQRAFYSYEENRFTFDFKGYFIYMDFPKNYPFDALNWRNEEIPYWTEKEFWKKYEHPPLPDN